MPAALSMPLIGLKQDTSAVHSQTSFSQDDPGFRVRASRAPE
jgi:hypothetical protein